jgi:hypothetical protein
VGATLGDDEIASGVGAMGEPPQAGIEAITIPDINMRENNLILRIIALLTRLIGTNDVYRLADYLLSLPLES